MTDKDQKSHNINKQKEKDDNLWAEMTKDVEPLKDKNTVPPSAKNTSRQPDRQEQNQTEIPEIPVTQNAKNDTPASRGNEVDHRTKQRLKRGQMPIEGRLDLHGMDQNQAYDALLQFIPGAYTAGKRCVLVVTGKGHQRHGDTSLLNQKAGVLKQKNTTMATHLSIRSICAGDTTGKTETWRGRGTIRTITA